MTQQINQVARVNAGNVKPVVIMLDESVHAAGYKCGDSTCPCADDPTFPPRYVASALTISDDEAAQLGGFYSGVDL